MSHGIGTTRSDLSWWAKERTEFGALIQSELRDIGRFLSERKGVVWFGAILFVLTFGFEITTFTQSLDEEQVINATKNVLPWMQDGRIGITLFKFFFMAEGMFPPFWGSALALIFFFASGVIHCSLFERISGHRGTALQHVAFLGLYIGTPLVVTDFFIFSTYNVEVTFSMMLLAISLRLVISGSRRSLGRMVLPVALIAFSVSIYQSNLVLFSTEILFVGLFSLVFAEPSDWNGRIKKLLIGLLLSFVIAVALFGVLDFLGSLFVAKRSYLSNFFRGEGLESRVSSILTLYFLNQDTGGFWLSIVFLSAPFLVVLIWLRLKRNRVVLTLGLLLALVLPFSLNLAIGSSVPFRSMQALLFASSALAYLLVGTLRFLKFTRLSVVICFGLLLAGIHQSQITAHLFYSDHIRFQNDRSTAFEIMHRIEDLVPDYRTKRVIVTGKLVLAPSAAISRVGIIGVSIFENENGNPYRIIPFINSLGYNLPWPAAEDVEKAREYANTMETWPKTGSIQEFGDLVVVNLHHE